MRVAWGVIALLCFGGGLVATETEEFKLTLSQVEEMACRCNLPLREARCGVAQGESRYEQSWGRWMPSVNWTGDLTSTPNNPAAARRQIYHNTVSVSQRLLSNDAYHDVRLKARERALLCGDQTIIANEVLFQARQTYYGVVLAKGQVVVFEDNVTLLKEALTQEEHRLEAGQSTSFQVNQSKVSVANALSGYYEAVKELRLAEDSLLRVVGLTPCRQRILSVEEEAVAVRTLPWLAKRIQCASEASRSADPLRIGTVAGNLLPCEPLFTDDEIAALETHLCRCHPALARQRTQMAWASERVSRQRGEYLPTLSAYANYVNMSADAVRLTPLTNYTESGLQLSWSLFDGFAREGRLREASMAWKNAGLEYQRILQEAKIALRDRLHEIEQAVYSYLAAQEATTLALEAADQAKERLKEGAITPLEFRDVANSLVQARYEGNVASYRLLVAYYGLQRELGCECCLK